MPQSPRSKTQPCRLSLLSYLLVLFAGFSCQSLKGSSAKGSSYKSPTKVGNFRISSKDATLINGQMFWVHLTNQETACEFLGQTIPVIANHLGEKGCLVPLDFHKSIGKQIFATIDRDGTRTESELTILDGNYPIEKLKVDGKYVEPPKSVLKRIQAEQKLLGKVYKSEFKPEVVDLGFILPVNSETTSRYGNRRFYNNIEKNFHAGTDLRAQVGTPIYAPGESRVELAQDLYFTGGTVILNHGYGVFTVYAHMSKVGVKVGTIVKQGDLLGLAGATGRVSGPHLHWGLQIAGQKVDPLALMALFGK